MPTIASMSGCGGGVLGVAHVALGTLAAHLGVVLREHAIWVLAPQSDVAVIMRFEHVSFVDRRIAARTACGAVAQL